MHTIKIVNVATGQEIEREMNADELAQYKKDELQDAQKLEAETTSETAKAAAQAKLAALGLNTNDLKALGL